MVNRYHTFLLITVISLLLVQNSFAQCNSQSIILKMDDVRANSNNTYNSNWQRFADTVRAYNINAGMGIILRDLNSGSQAFKDSLVSWHASEHFEIWHHGWQHTRGDYPPDNNNAGEFSGPPYEHQKKLFEDGMDLAKQELGITLRSFGAPYNQTDATFAQVISESPDMKVWMYCTDPAYGEMCLLRGSNNKLESSTGVVSFDSFLTAYESNTNPYLVLQGHPGQWTTESFEQFELVIDYLKDKGHCFYLPYDYYLQEINNPILYTQKFSDPDSLYIEDNAHVIVDQTCCEELKIENNSSSLLPKDSPITHPISINGAENTVDIGESTKLYIRARSENATEIRIDLSDGEHASDGANGKLTKSLPADLTDWTILEYEFSATLIQASNIDPQGISEINIFPNPSEDGLISNLYIDYLSLGAPPENYEATCRSDIDRDGCALMYEDYFDDQKKVLFTGQALEAVDTLVSGCGELVLSMKTGETFASDASLFYEFPQPIDFTQNPLVVLRLRSADRMELRIDLTDGTKPTNGTNGKITRTVPGNRQKWSEVYFEFPQDAFAENNVDSTAITGFGLFLNPGTINFPGTLYLDVLAAGKPSGNGYAIGKTEEDPCGEVDEILTAEKIDTHTINIYPNPADNTLNIGFASEWNGASIQITNIMGQVLISEKLNDSKQLKTIDVSDLSSAVYYLLIDKNRRRKISKIIKR